MAAQAALRWFRDGDATGLRENATSITRRHLPALQIVTAIDPLLSTRESSHRKAGSAAVSATVRIVHGI